ncbi:MAG TPA: MaoC/PaaZ C-terminal domain-containing protein [Chloroflexota bacterium]|jgi:acyl dehydratase
MSTAATRPTLASVSEGMALPELVKRPTIVQSMMVQAATENYHRIHWDREFARADGLPDVILSTSFLANCLVQLVVEWTGDPTALRRLSYRFHRPVSPDQTLYLRGRVVSLAPGEGEVACELRIDVDDAPEPAVTGRTMVALPSA